MIKKALLALAITGAMATAQAGVNLAVSEGFDQVGNINTITRLQASGWVIDNKSTAPGITTWFQGDQTILTSQDGPANSYLAANYSSATDGGLLNNFLETPVFSTASGVIVSFYLNAAIDGNFFDQVDFGFIDATTGVFTSALGSLLTVTTDTWTKYTVTLSNTPGSARFAIDYAGLQANASYLGLDSLTVQVPEPTSIAILAAGLIGMGAARRRKQRG